MKLHLGCGTDWRRDYLNVDSSPFSELSEWARREGRLMVLLPGEEFLQWDLREPWPDASAEEIVCNQTLEHFTDAELPSVLAEAWRVLTPGAIFSGTVPNFRAVYEATVLRGEGSGWPLGDTGPYPWPWMNALQNLAHGGGHHKQVFVTEMLLERLRMTGFAATVREVPGWNLYFEAWRAER